MSIVVQKSCDAAPLFRVRNVIIPKINVSTQFFQLGHVPPQTSKSSLQLATDDLCEFSITIRKTVFSDT